MIIVDAEHYRLLFCDFDGGFEYADFLMNFGYFLDKIHPSSLRHTSIDEYQICIFSFRNPSGLEHALKACDELKSASFSSPIVLLNESQGVIDFIVDHDQAINYANAYCNIEEGLAALFDTLDCLHKSSQRAAEKLYDTASDEDRDERNIVHEYECRLRELQEKLQTLESQSAETLEAQRNFFGAKLKAALLESQKRQNETASLLVQLSEIEAKLLDREVKIKESEYFRDKNQQRLNEIRSTHERAQQAIRQFYQNKIRSSAPTPRLADSDSR